MSDVEKEKDKLSDVDDDVTPFYKEAFQCFDWNNSGRISTSVSNTKTNKIPGFSILLIPF